MDFFKRLKVPEVWHVGEGDATTAACAGALLTTCGDVFFWKYLSFSHKKKAEPGHSQNSEEPKGVETSSNVGMLDKTSAPGTG